jgi:zinc protease
VIFKLENGLEVVLEENHTAPVVAFQAWVRIGAAHEPAPLAGVSHFLEHMLFKGTARRGVGQIAQEIEGAGGEINAWTSYDETVYHVVLASPFFATGLDVLADALTGSSFDPAELEKERGVILEEVKQGQDDPDRVAAQALFAQGFSDHPYGRPVIGGEHTVRAMSRKDVAGFYRENYRPERTTLVVVGDFAAADARRAIEKALSGWSRPAGTTRAGGAPVTRAGSKRSPAALFAPAPTTGGPRVRVLARDVKETQILVGFRVPHVTHDDIAALDLLAVALGQGDSSRLNVEIVRNQQRAKSAYTYLFGARQAGLIVAGATLGRGNVEDTSKALIDELLRMGRVELRPEELDKARAILESDRVFDKETVQGYARKLGFFTVIAGDVHYEDRYLSRLAGLTPADVRAVAARYLSSSNMSLVAQIPRQMKGVSAEALAKKLEGVTGKAEARADRRFGRVQTALATEDVVRHVLPSGMKVLILPDRSVPIVAVRAMWVGGLRFETPPTNGISNLQAALLTKGTRTRTAEQIAVEVEAMAGSLSGYSGRNSLGVQAEFLARHFDKGLEVVADCIQNATFTDDELDKERRIVLDDIAAQNDNVGHAAFRLFHSAFWKHHPYRFDLLGTADSVSALTRRRLLTHFRKHYRLGNLTLAVVGDVEPGQVLDKLSRLFGGTENDDATTTKLEPPLIKPEPPPEPSQAFEFLEREQAHVVLGFPGTTLANPDRFGLEVLAHVLSGQGGRMFSELREKRGLVYRVSAFSMEGIDPGYFAVYLAASPSNLDEAVAAVRAELRNVVDNGITADELERSRRYLIGSHAIGLQRKSAVAAALAFHEAYGQGWQEYRRFPERITKVKLDDMKRLARKYLDVQHEVLAVVKPSSKTPAAAARSAAARAP